MLGIMSQWESGEITSQEAYNVVADERGEIQEVYDHAKAALDANKAALERIVSRMGGKASGAGYDVVMVESAATVSYDAKALDGLTAELLAAGDAHTAAKIAQARQETTRKGYLRIGKTKHGA